MIASSRRAVLLCALLAAALAGAGCGPSSSPSTADDGGSPAQCDGRSFDGTYDAIQTVVFEGRGCTQAVCHGSAQQGGLDLRAGSSYRALFEARSPSSGGLRVLPGQPTQSVLYQKLAAATRPGSFDVVGSPMPSGLPPISEGELAAIKIWIESGAPEHGSVGDPIRGESQPVADLLGACLPPATPISIEPLAPPAPEEGVQLAMPTFVLPASTEVEVCFAQYYDVSDRVPAAFQDAARGVFFVNGSHLRQDPQSHHLVIAHSGLGPDRVHDPEFGAWTCKGGARDGETCEPTDPAACGADGLCGSEVRDAIACIGFGPDDGAVNVAGGGIGGAQTSQQINPPRGDGFYAEIPLRGILYWNSHAFNLTSEDHRMHAWQNYQFARQRTVPIQAIIDVHAIYDQAGQPPFTVERYCARHVLPEGALLLSLSSHTHKRGRHFTVDTADGARIYESFEYHDPVNQSYEPPLRFDQPDPAARTLTYCADFNNGVRDDGTPDTRLVTRLSTMPDRTTCVPVACAAGRVGASCRGASDDVACDSAPGAGDGACDACPITAGATTENEMFVLTGSYALPPE
jgi:hypothetical protein